MVCRTEVFGAISYDYCPDDLPPSADRIQSLMHGRFIDELKRKSYFVNLESAFAEIRRALNRSGAVSGQPH